MKDDFREKIDEMFRSLSDEQVLSFVGWLLYQHGIELKADTRHRGADILQARLSRSEEGCKTPAESARRTFGCCSSSHKDYKRRHAHDNKIK